MRLLTVVTVALLCMLCACTGAPDAAKVIEKAESGETLTDEDYKVLNAYVNSALTSDEAKAVNKASNEALRHPSPQTRAAMQSAVEKMEKEWSLLQKASLYMMPGGVLLPVNEDAQSNGKSDAPAN